MKFGVLQFFSWPGRRVPLPTVYERALDRIRIMDETGYDCVWLAEHHFSTYSVCPSVHLMAMHAADRTENLRIGTAVTLAAFYHPLRIAEEIALLDVLTGGRVNWGAGRGFDLTEFRAFDVPREESAARFRESVEVVLAAWRNERINFHGDYYDFEDIEVLPKPFQQPTPPFWVAAGSPDAIDWAAEKGYSILLDPHSPHATIHEKKQRFFSGLEKHGHEIADRVLPTARLLALAETDEQAREVATRGAEWTLGSYANEKTSGRIPVIAQNTEQADPVKRYVDQVMIHGSPAKVADQLVELRETIGLDYLMCAPLSHESFMRFTKEVLPKLL